jgi:hypothetical protein
MSRGGLGSGWLFPHARCAGGPLPRPAFRSFLATAGDPSPNFGGGVVSDRSEYRGWCGVTDGAPLSRPLPHKLRGGEVTRATDCRSGIEFSPFSRAAGERGRGRGGVSGASSMQFVEPGSPPPAVPPPCPERHRILPFPRAVYGGRGRGMGGAVGRQSALRSARSFPHPQPPPGVFGGGGRVVLARRGRAVRAGACRSAIEFSPFSRAAGERGRGRGGVSGAA